ncbi:DUF1223 domain-containing protein [Sphingomonas oryzagri]
MRKLALGVGFISLAGIAAMAWADHPAGPHRPAIAAANPVVVELFQSQGCSDCPPAQQNLNTLADRPDVLALSFGVTYWDYLGWNDSFASPRFTERQRDYSSRNNGVGVATPQYWINGRKTVLGANPSAVSKAIAFGGPTGGPTIAVTQDHVAVGSAPAPAGGADVWLVRYDPRTIQVAIRAGENGGRTIPHRDIVRSLTRIGHWVGTAQSLSLPANTTPALLTAVLVQAGRGGPILAAAKG